MEFIEISKLKPHPENDFFFDDITGAPWGEFLDSIKTNGVIEPIVITPDYTIVSGHQRVRACKHLGIKEIAATTKHFDSEDDVLRALIETNIRQRGIGNPNPVKFGYCLKELERIYGIKQGGDRANQNNFGLKSQKDIADEIGISDQQLRNYKSLTDLIPELQDAVQSGQITATTAMGFVKKLSPEEQKRLAEEIGGKEKVSNREVDFYIKRVQALTEENKELREREPIIRTIREEVIPEDYEETKEKLEKAERAAEEANTAKKAIYDASMKEKRQNFATDIDVLIGRYRQNKEFADQIKALLEVRKTIVV